MSTITLPISFNDKRYYFNKWTGLVLIKHINNIKIEQRPNNKKLLEAHEKISDPYLLKLSTKISNIPYYSVIVIIYAKLLVLLCKLSFHLAILFSKLKIVRFNTAAEAISVFRDIFPNDKQRDLCLPRSLFAASASRAFNKSGVLFIGIFLPSRHMHAWLIENNTQPDILDDIWICYQPIAAII